MRRPRTTVYDPAWLLNGEHGKQTAVEDEYFADDNHEAYALILSHLVARLEEPVRSAVQMVVFGNLSYEDAADHIAVDWGRRPHKKTVWKWCRRGLLQLKRWLEDMPWASELTEGRIPLPDDEVMLHPTTESAR